MRFKFPHISQTTISAVVGVLGSIAYAVLPYLQASPNSNVRMVAAILAAIGFGNGIRAAPDASDTIKKADVAKLPPDEPLTPSAIVSVDTTKTSG